MRIGTFKPSKISNMHAARLLRGFALIFWCLHSVSSLLSFPAFVSVSSPVKSVLGISCTSTLRRSAERIPFVDGGKVDKILGSRRLHKALNKPDTVHTTNHRARKETGSGDWGKVLPMAERPRRPPLDKLSDDELQRILAGERLQKQSRAGRTGRGLVVCDVEADASIVYAVLSDIQRYPMRVPTVREASVQYDNHRCKAQFKLSRFRLEINAELRCLRDRNAIEFRLDPERQNPVLEQARGFWFVEDATCYGRPKGWSRVWLVADVICSPFLPSFLVDHAASRALPRATSWIVPVLGGISRATAENGGLPSQEETGASLPSGPTPLAVAP